MQVQGSAKGTAQGLVDFAHTVVAAYHFYLALFAACKQTGAQILAQLCTEVMWTNDAGSIFGFRSDLN